MLKRRLYDYPLWNLFLLTLGSIFVGIGTQAVASPHGFLTGGFIGLGLLFEYYFGIFQGTTWNLFFNIPLLAFGLVKYSFSFMFYSIYGALAISISGGLIKGLIVPVQDPLYACILSGVLMGVGGGLMLRSKGSGGGLDLITVHIYQKWNIPIGTSSFAFNTILFSSSLMIVPIDLVIISFIQVYISRQVINYVVALFNQRKIVWIVTNKGQEMCYAIAAQGGRTTIMPAYGGYSHDSREIIMTITTNATVRNLEELVFRHDPQAIFSVEDTFYVSGGQYKKVRK